MKNEIAFTLAEVLVTLVIIGVVSALTIPSVIVKYQEKETVTAVKKFYSEINQAYSKAIINNGPIESWGWTKKTGAGAEKIMDILAPYLRIQKRCGAGGSKGRCFNDITYKTLNPSVNWSANPSTNSNYSTAKLNNGFLIWIQSTSPDCSAARGTITALQNICGDIGVDINGHKKPNALGRDTFYFRISKYGIIPMGLKEDIDNSLETRCKLSSTNTSNGYACTAWILAKGNMDYLRRTVSW